MLLREEVCRVEPSGQVKLVKDFLYVEISTVFSELVCKVMKSEGFIPRTLSCDWAKIDFSFSLISSELF